jgi:prolipoprotein diacylglyceryltransferase
VILFVFDSLEIKSPKSGIWWGYLSPIAMLEMLAMIALVVLLIFVLYRYKNKYDLFILLFFLCIVSHMLVFLLGLREKKKATRKTWTKISSQILTRIHFLLMWMNRPMRKKMTRRNNRIELRN